MPLLDREFFSINPGEVLVQDTFPIFEFLPNWYVHVLIDTYSSYAFAYKWPEKSVELIIPVLNTKALEFFSKKDFIVKKIITDRGYEFARQGKTYANFLNNHGIIHEIHSNKNRNWNGFIERYKRSFLKRYKQRFKDEIDSITKGEMINKIINDKFIGSKVILGYPNFGLRPVELINRKHLTKLEPN